MRTEMSGPAPENRVALQSVYEFIFALPEPTGAPDVFSGEGGQRERGTSTEGVRENPRKWLN